MKVPHIKEDALNHMHGSTQALNQMHAMHKQESSSLREPLLMLAAKKNSGQRFKTQPNSMRAIPLHAGHSMKQLPSPLPWKTSTHIQFLRKQSNLSKEGVKKRP